MDVEIRDSRFEQVVDIDAKMEKLATGFDFTEGPIWHPKYESVLFSDIMGNSLYSWRADAGVVKRKINSYMANGNSYDLQGRLLTCEHATSRVTRTDMMSGSYKVLASHYNGKQLNSPNDIVVKSDGVIYFTDPLAGRSEQYGVPREGELGFCGVYKLDVDSGDLTLLADDFTLPNGLCFSRDESQLFVNDTRKAHIRVFDGAADGTLINGRVWAETTGELEGAPDGMKVDSLGHVYCTGPGGIQVFDTDGVCLGVILMPEKTANFCFGDADMRGLYITASTSLYHLRVKVSGWPIPVGIG